jgi:hypothetical protein
MRFTVRFGAGAVRQRLHTNDCAMSHDALSRRVAPRRSAGLVDCETRWVGVVRCGNGTRSSAVNSVVLTRVASPVG